MNFPAIDLLRALAALLVLVYHVIVLSAWSRLTPAEVPTVLRNGWVGVDLFLTISGFVIALSALQGIKRHGLAFRPSFVRHRLARIVPLYLLTLVAFVVLVQPQLLLLKAKFLAHFGSHLLFVHNLTHHAHGSINGPSWSVALEMQFYILMLWLAPRLSRIGWVRLVVGTLLFAAAWRAAVVWVLGPDASAMLKFIYITQLPGVIDQFAMGMAFALILLEAPPRLRRWLEPGAARSLGWAAVAALLLTAAAWWQGESAYLFDSTMIIAWRPLLAAGFAALLAAAITCPRDVAEARWLAPVRYLGQISYGIYLWHMLVLLTVLNAVPQLQGLRLLAYVVVASVVLAAISWHWLEKPFMARTRLRDAVPAPVATPAQARTVEGVTPAPAMHGG